MNGLQHCVNDLKKNCVTHSYGCNSLTALITDIRSVFQIRQHMLFLSLAIEATLCGLTVLLWLGGHPHRAAPGFTHNEFSMYRSLNNNS